jgi:hypothetical protein
VGTTSAAAQSAGAKNFLINMGCPNALPENRISGLASYTQ